MEKEQIKKLNEIRKYLEISKEDFIEILALAKMHQKNSRIFISDDMLYEIIEEALLNTDYEINEKNKYIFYDDSFIEKNKSIQENLIRAIKTLDF